MIERLLKIKKEKNRKKPTFLRQETWKVIKFKNNPKWRKPRGHSSKMRRKLKGNPPVVNIGYRNPKLVRGYHPCGVPEVLVHNVKDLENLKDVAVRIGNVGTRKKIEILKGALEKNLKVLNPKIKFIKVSNEEDMTNNIQIKDYTQNFIISKKLSDDDREKIEQKAEELGIVLQE
jgi:large subunit ribosomal protein L32e